MRTVSPDNLGGPHVKSIEPGAARIILALLLVLVPAMQARPAVEAGLALRVLRLARGSVDGHREIPRFEAGSRLEGMASVIDYASRARGPEIDGAVREAVHFAFSLPADVRDARRRAEAERRIVMSLARIDHDAAVKLAARISGTHTRAAALEELGTFAYPTLPDDPKLQIGYYRERALREKDPREAVRLWMQAMDVALRVGRGHDAVGHLAQPVADAPLPDLRALAATDRALAVAFLRKRLDVERLALNSGSSTFVLDSAELYIPFLERLVEIAPDLAVEEARTHVFETYPDELRTVAMFVVARKLQDRDSAVQLAREARSLAQRHREGLAVLGIAVQYEVDVKEIDRFLGVKEPPPVKPAPRTYERLLDEIVRTVTDGGRRLENREWTEIYEELSRRDQKRARQALSRRIVPAIRKVAKDDERAALLVDAAGLLKDHDARLALDLVHYAVAALKKSGGFDEFPARDVMGAWIELEPAAARAFVFAGLVEAVDSQERISEVLSCLASTDMKTVVDLLERSRYDADAFLAPLGSRTVRVGPAVVYGVAERLRKEQGPDAAVAWLSRWPPFENRGYEDARGAFVWKLVEEHRDTAVRWARETRDEALRRVLVVRLFSADPAVGRPLLVLVREPQQQAELARALAYQAPGDAVGVAEGIEDAAWRFATVVRLARDMPR